MLLIVGGMNKWTDDRRMSLISLFLHEDTMTFLKTQRELVAELGPEVLFLI